MSTHVSGEDENPGIEVLSDLRVLKNPNETNLMQGLYTNLDSRKQEWRYIKVYPRYAWEYQSNGSVEITREDCARTNAG